MEEINKEIFNSSFLSSFEKRDLLDAGKMMKQMAVWVKEAKEAYFARVRRGNQAQYSISWQCAAAIAADAVSTLGLASCGVTLGFGCGVAVVGKLFSYAGIFGSC